MAGGMPMWGVVVAVGLGVTHNSLVVAHTTRWINPDNSADPTSSGYNEVMEDYTMSGN